MTTQPTVRRIDQVTVAKMAVNILKKAFPKTKFTRTTSRYSGGSSVTIYWTDGPTVKQVENLIGHMEGASFDGMQDLKTYHDSTDPATGERIRYANDYMFCTRTITNEAALIAFTALKNSIELELTPWGLERLAIDDYYELIVDVPGTAPYWRINHKLTGQRSRYGNEIVQAWLSRHDLSDPAKPVAVPRD